jgi:thiol-disulfide isomerase/thioredoxin
VETVAAQQTGVLTGQDDGSAVAERPPGALVATPPPRSQSVQEPSRSALLDLPPPVEPEPSGAQAAGAGPVASGSDLLPPPVENADPPPSTRRALRWRDLAANKPDPPPREGGTREPDSYCHFDAKRHRIEDFRLPDLQGRLVRFQDLDADLILLDFWGTWCQPCLRSIPHLTDLQKRLAGKQFQVVGIACERGEMPAGERIDAVARTIQKLKINYPVLISSMDGTCPLQQALHVQAYPTLVLLDRHGRILWQDQGGTRLTLSRLDRMLDLTLKSSDGRRRY